MRIGTVLNIFFITKGEMLDDICIFVFFIGCIVFVKTKFGIFIAV